MSYDKEPFFLHEEVERKYGFARAIKHAGLLYVSGTVSVGRDGAVVGKGCMRTQVETVYANLGAILQACGTTPEKVVKETIFATDLDSFLENSEARLAFYAQGSPPATTGVEVKGLTMPDLLVEIELTAAL